MTIQKSTYSICKTVRALPWRGDVCTLVDNLNKGSRGSFGLLARQQFRQFMGYLYPPKMLAPGGGPMPEMTVLNDVERKLIVRANSVILEVDNAILKFLGAVSQTIPSAVNPYPGFELGSFESGGNEKVLEGEVANLLVEISRVPEFIRLVEILKAIVVEKGKALPFDAGVAVYERCIAEAGIQGVPEDFKLMEYQGGPTRAIHKAVCYLVCIRGMIQNINQLIFQMFISDKLFALGDENIFELGGLNSNSVGANLTLSIQLNSMENYLISAGSIALLTLDRMMLKGRLASIQSIQTNFSKKAGDFQRLELRLLGENLSPFEGLGRP
jgi:hypothetical protein